MSRNRAIILGCGPANGVPTVSSKSGGEWGSCDPHNPKNRRTRASLYLEYEGMRLLIDTSSDFREQYLKNNLSGLDAVLLTHCHTDHVSGIDELRKVSASQGKTPIPLYLAQETFDQMEGMFGYLFKQNKTYGIYPKVLEKNIIESDFSINGHLINVFTQPHGEIDSFGFRFGDLAYSTDFHTLSPEILEGLKGIKVWIMDCLAIHGTKPTHSTYEQNLKYIDIVKPERVYLTHMGIYVDYDKITSLLPDSIKASYDGLEISF